MNQTDLGLNLGSVTYHISLDEWRMEQLLWAWVLTSLLGLITVATSQD